MDLENIYKEMLAERESRLEHQGTIIGTCEEYCPKFEYIERKIRGDISRYENNIVFKKFYRSSAGKSKSFPEDVRPIHVLLQATNYLIDLSYNDFSMEMYKFIENRTRAIRMDLNLQDATSKMSIEILEKIARFHIIYYYVLFDNKEFEAHLNQDQLKKILLTLENLYHKNNISNEEFISYILLLSIDSKYPQLETFLTYPKVRQAYNIRRYYQQGNIFRYFCECRKLDLLSFCVSLMSFDKVRMKAIEMFDKSLMEKVDINFFYNLLYTSEREVISLFSKMNVYVFEDKADFKDSDIYESEEYLVKERKEPIGLKSLSVLIYLGDIESKILKLICRNYTCRLLRSKYNKKVDLSDIKPHSERSEEIIFRVLINQISEKYSSVIYQNLRKLLVIKKSKKEIIKIMCYSVLKVYLRNKALRYTERYLSKLYLKRQLKNWIEAANVSGCEMKKEDENYLAVVLNDSIYSVILKNTIEKSGLFNLHPVFFNYKEVSPLRLLKFRLTVFSVDKNSRKEVEKNFHMINKIVEIPQNIMKMFDVIEETAKKSKCTKKSKILNLLKNKNKNKQIYIVTKLIENKRNSPDLEDILVSLYNNKTIKNIDVYHEEGEDF